MNEKHINDVPVNIYMEVVPQLMCSCKKSNYSRKPHNKAFDVQVDIAYV